MARTVTVNAAHDDDASADPPVNLNFVVTGADYDGHQVNDLVIKIVEDDVPGVVVDAPTNGVIVEEGGPGSLPGVAGPSTLWRGECGVGVA